MSVDDATVDHVAALARLALSNDERAQLRSQLSAILDYINVIAEADTSGVPATANVLPLENVVRILAENKWPWRLHATYDETISRALDVYERVNRDTPLDGLHWFFDHCETISDRNIDRIAELGGGIAIQHRMAFQGEYFVERYGRAAAERTPPIQRMLRNGLPVNAETDTTRVASYNPWVSLAWLVTGKTVGGLKLYLVSQTLDREQALRLWTEANAWFSGESLKKGQIAVGQLADLAVLSDDYFNVADDRIADITSVLTLLGGRPVHASNEFADFAPPLPPAMPDWSPIRHYGGYQRPAEAAAAAAVAGLGTQPIAAHRCEGAHLHTPRSALWGDFGCACWAF